MRKEMTICPGCGEAFAAGLVQLSRGHGALRCPVCSEMEVAKTRLGMREGQPMTERRFWEEVAKRLAAYGSREGVAIELKIAEGTESKACEENGSNRV